MSGSVQCRIEGRRARGVGSAVPGVSIRERDLEMIIGHCVAALPDEACGLLAGREGTVETVYPMKNARSGPASYEMEPEEQFRVLKEIRAVGRALLGIFHSHPGGPACPSGVDAAKAYWPRALFPNSPSAVQVIISLADRAHPVARAFVIEQGSVEEAALSVLRAGS